MKQVLIALDQLANTLIGGWADESLSCRCWRRSGDPAWNRARKVIDGLFFWQRNHCQQAYFSEQNRLQMPPELRG